MDTRIVTLIETATTLREVREAQNEGRAQALTTGTAPAVDDTAAEIAYETAQIAAAPVLKAMSDEDFADLLEQVAATHPKAKLSVRRTRNI